jgi:5-methylcytosine-specific restriction protein A
MPSAAPRVCQCGNVVESGVVCACRSAAIRERKARFDAKRPSAFQRGYDTKWAQARKEFLAINPRCSYPSCNAFAVLVDHRTPHRGDMRIFWDRSKWQGLCLHHHNSAKQRMECR